MEPLLSKDGRRWNRREMDHYSTWGKLACRFPHAATGGMTLCYTVVHIRQSDNSTPSPFRTKPNSTHITTERNHLEARTNKQIRNTKSPWPVITIHIFYRCRLSLYTSFIRALYNASLVFQAARCKGYTTIPNAANASLKQAALPNQCYH